MTYDLRAVAHAHTFRGTVAPADVRVETVEAAPLDVPPTAPAGTVWRGATLSITARADLQVTQADVPDPVTVGDALTYAVTVRNAGPDDAGAVTLADLLPAGAALVSAAPSQGSCAPSAATVVCALGEVVAGASATVEVVVRPGVEATLVNQVRVSAAEPDPLPANDAVTESTTVRAKAAEGGGGGGGGGGGCGCGGGAEGAAEALLALLALRGAGRTRARRS